MLKDRINSARLNRSPSSPVSQAEGFFELVFEPSLRVVDLTRRYVEELYGGDSGVSAALSITAHELLENLAKHASAGEARFSVRVSYDAGRAVIAVRTRNKAAPDRVDRLQRVLAAIDESNDPARHYLELLKQSRNGAEVALGLARTRADSNLVLSLQRTRDEVTVMANSR
jgi:hypothetical protein